MQSRCILTVNGGSSSIRCALYDTDSDNNITGVSRIKIDGIGHRNARLSISSKSSSQISREIDATQFKGAIDALLAELTSQQGYIQNLQAIGHRIVHGMQHCQPQLINESLLNELQPLQVLDPEHLPFELALVKAFGERFPAIPQIACFDTAFHRSMPDVAKTLPLPAAYRDTNIERYGFHGLSYAYLMRRLTEIDKRAAQGRVVLAHLGNGASLAAVSNGKCIDTSMSFTPASGIMMSTRCGDIDPGILYHLCKSRGISVDDLQHGLNHKSGMLGVSGVSGDVRTLLDQERSNPRAALAIDMFCYHVRKCIGAYTAALGGLDTLIFSGGIGENAPIIRQRICEGLQFLGIRLDTAMNDSNREVISTADSLSVRMIHTDEELMIAKLVMQCQSS